MDSFFIFRCDLFTFYTKYLSMSLPQLITSKYSYTKKNKRTFAKKINSMIQLGEINELTAIRITDFGWFLEDEEGNEVLLPNKFVSEDLKENDKINVFIFKDSEDRITATTQTPLIGLNEFASLRVRQINKYGAFLSWGLDKDLMVPYSQQQEKMEEDESYVVRLMIDEKSDRLYATSKLTKYLINDHITVKEGEKVDIIIIQETDLGYKAIIDDARRWQNRLEFAGFWCRKYRA